MVGCHPPNPHPVHSTGGTRGKEPACLCRRHKRQGFDPWVGKIPWRRKWQLTPVFLPGESHGQRSLAVHRSHRVAESRTRQKRLRKHTRMHTYIPGHTGRGEKAPGLPLRTPNHTRGRQACHDARCLTAGRASLSFQISFSSYWPVRNTRARMEKQENFSGGVCVRVRERAHRGMQPPC